ncbi:hypothetical protein B7494_g7192 [Chlorociboria aeruginascens]|nr:hypothetical protein B7494_g7192 [Chlorociboria aeruginascens]
MHFTLITAAIMAFASSTFAQVSGFDVMTSPADSFTYNAGSTLNIIWAPGTEAGNVTLTLMQGASPGSLQVGPVLATNYNNTLGKYPWAIPTDMTWHGTYGINISLVTNVTHFQYSFPFYIAISGTASPATSV